MTVSKRKANFVSATRMEISCNVAYRFLMRKDTPSSFDHAFWLRDVQMHWEYVGLYKTGD